MNPSVDFRREHGYVLPVYPKASGKATTYIEGYPAEDDEPMAETQFHARQIVTLSYQLGAFFGFEEKVYIGTDNFIYYAKGDISKKVAPDIFVVLGVDAIPARRSFYTWAEGVAPAVAFEFLSDSTERKDRAIKPQLYLQTIGMQEYFIHQPQGDRRPESRGWRRTAAGEIIEIPPELPPWMQGASEQMALFSKALNLWFMPEDQPDKVKLLRPYYPDGTPLPTYEEVKQERNHARQERDQFEQERDQFEEERNYFRTRTENLEAEVEKLRALLDERSS